MVEKSVIARYTTGSDLARDRICRDLPDSVRGFAQAPLAADLWARAGAAGIGWATKPAAQMTAELRGDAGAFLGVVVGDMKVNFFEHGAPFH